MVSGSRSCCHLRPHRLVAVLGATRSSAGFHYLRFRIRTSPIDSFYPADVLTPCGVPTGYERLTPPSKSTSGVSASSSFGAYSMTALLLQT